MLAHARNLLLVAAAAVLVAIAFESPSLAVSGGSGPPANFHQVFVALKTGFTNRASTVSETCDPTFEVTGLNLGKHYAVDAVMTFAAGGATAQGFRVSVPTYNNVGFTETSNNTGSSTYVAPLLMGWSWTNGDFIQTTFPSTSSIAAVHINGVTTGVSTFCPAWAQGTSSASATTLEYSYMTLTQLD